MKKLLLIAIQVVIFCGLFYSCEGDEEVSYDFIENATFDTSLMFGRWDVEYIDVPSQGSIWNDFTDIRMTFNKDGTFTIKFSTSEYEENTITSEYKVKGDVITLDLDTIVTIELVNMDEYDVYFWMKYYSGNGSYSSMYCKGGKR